MYVAVEFGLFGYVVLLIDFSFKTCIGNESISTDNFQKTKAYGQGETFPLPVTKTADIGPSSDLEETYQRISIY